MKKTHMLLLAGLLAFTALLIFRAPHDAEQRLSQPSLERQEQSGPAATEAAPTIADATPQPAVKPAKAVEPKRTPYSDLDFKGRPPRWDGMTVLDRAERTDLDSTRRQITLIDPEDGGYPVRIVERLQRMDDGSVASVYEEMVANRVVFRADADTDFQQLQQRLSFMGHIEPISSIGHYRFILNETTIDGVEDAQAALEAAAADLLYSEPDYIYHAVLAPDDPEYTNGALWGMNNTGQDGGTADADIDAPEGWDIRTDASNVIVGVIDTGVRYTHEDIADNMWINPGEDGLDGLGNSKRDNGVDDDGNGWIDDVYGIDARNNDGDPLDDHGHGSHCSGTIAGVGNNGVGVAGVAWKAKIMALKFLGENGGSSSDAIICLDYAISKGARLTSNSWGGGGFSQALYDIIAAARDADQLFVVAAANDSSDNDVTTVYPTGYKLANILSVAAMNHEDELASFSNFGSGMVDVGAPGRDIISLGIDSDSDYKTFSGTSMATPATAGLAALLHAEFPGSDSLGIKNRILSGGRDVAALYGKTTSGRFINLPGSLQTTSDAPTNDDFADAQRIHEEPETLRANNAHATYEAGEPAHAGLGTNSIWFVYDATVTGTTIVNTRESAIDTVAAVYTGSSVGSLTLVGSNDDFGEETYSMISFDAVEGTRYYIAVAGKDGASGYIQLTLSGPPEEDFIADALDIPWFPFTYESDNTNASKEPGEQDHAGKTGGASLWLKLRLADHGLAGQNVVLTTRNSEFDTLMAVYSSSEAEPGFNDLVEVLSNDDAPYGETYSEVSFSADANTTYWVVTDGKDNARGRVRMWGHPQTVNDDFDQAATLNGDITSVTIPTLNAYYATREFGEPNHDNANGLGSLWYVWSPNTADSYSIRTSGINAIGVYTGTELNALTLVAPDLSNGDGPSQAILTSANPGTSYYIAVDNRGVSGIFGPTVLTIEPYFTLENDDWENATLLEGDPTEELPFVVEGENTNGTKQSGEPGSLMNSTIWLKWVAPRTATYRADTLSVDLNTTLAVYSTPATPTGFGDFTEVAYSSEDGIDNDTVLKFDAVAGTTYYFQIGTAFAGDFGDFSFTLKPYSAPANDDLANAEEVTNFFVQREIDYFGATREAGEPSHQPDNDYWNSDSFFYEGPTQAVKTLWYKWTPADASQARRTAASSFGSGGSTVVAVYETTVSNPGFGDLTLVKPPNSNWYTWWSWGEVWWDAELGKTYYIMLGHQYDNDFDLYRLSITQNPNDNFAERELLPSTNRVTRYTSNFAASTESGEPRIDSSIYGGRSLWYEWTAPADGVYVFDTIHSYLRDRFTDLGLNPDSQNNGGNMQMAVYTGSSLDNLTKQGSNAGISMRDANAMVSIDATAGTSYKIAIDSQVGPDSIVTGNTQEYTMRSVIQFNISSGTLANDDIDDATEISGDYHQEFIDLKFATRESGEPSHGGRSNRSAWWKWTAPDSATYYVATSSDVFDSQDNRKPGIAVYSGPPTNPTFGVLSTICEDNNDEGSSTYEPAYDSFSAVAGQTYYMAIDDGGATPVNSGYKSGLLLAKKAPNNDWANATEIIGSTRTVTGHNLGSTWQSGEPQIDSWGTDSSQRSVWWTWTAPASGQTTVTTDGSYIYNELGVYTGIAVDALSLVVKEITGGSFDNGDTYAERADMANRTVSFTATAGTTYYFMVVASGYKNMSLGPITLSVSGQPGQPIEPTDLTASRITASRVNLAWTDNAVDESTYVIHRTAGLGGSWQEVFNSGEADTESWSDLNADSNYVYRVRAEGAGGVSDWVLVTTLPNDPPSASITGPASSTVRLQNVTDRLVLEGEASDDGVTGYLSFLWSQVSGPGTASFEDASDPDTTVTFDASGVYVLRLTANDGIESHFSEITIVVDGEIPTDNMVLHYRFDETNGVAVADSSTNSNNGTVSGNDHLWSTGVLDGAIDLTGTSITYVASGSAVAVDESNGFTAAAWVAPRSYGVDNRIILQQEDGAGTGRSLLSMSPEGHLYTFIGGDTTEGGTISTGQWHHVAVCAGSGTIRLYIDGREVASSNDTVEANSAPLRSGNHKSGSATLDKQWDGLIDDLRFYERPLSTNEIQILAAYTGEHLAPVVDAGSNRTVTVGAAAALEGSASDDGLPAPPGALSYTWSQLSGPAVTISNANSATGSVVLADLGAYVFRLTVSDGDVAVADDVTLTTQTSPASLNAVETATGEVTLNWPDADGETGYRVRMRRSGETNWVTLSTDMAANATNYTVAGLQYSQLYEFGVNALDEGTPRVGASASRTISPPASGFLQNTNAPHLVVIEAEHYAETGANGSADSWTLTSAFDDYSGEGAMQVMPDDSGIYLTSVPTTAPYLNYEVVFNQTGTHYLYVRCREPGGAMINGSDSLHAGINGVMPTTAETIEKDINGTGIGTTFVWAAQLRSGARITLDVPSTGTHTIHIWPREDGIIVDKILLTTDVNYTPTGTEPESDQSGTAVLTAIESWRQTHFGLSAAIGDATDTADLEPDGLVNLAEFAFGGDPRSADAWKARLEVIDDPSSDLAFSFRRRKGSGTGTTETGYSVDGIRYKVVTTTNLVNGGWAQDPSLLEQAGDPADNGDGTETITVRVLTDSNPDIRTRALRLDVETK